VVVFSRAGYGAVLTATARGSRTMMLCGYGGLSGECLGLWSSRCRLWAAVVVYGVEWRKLAWTCLRLEELAVELGLRCQIAPTSAAQSGKAHPAAVPAVNAPAVKSPATHRVLVVGLYTCPPTLDARGIP
jgi:hypothetical protein